MTLSDLAKYSMTFCNTIQLSVMVTKHRAVSLQQLSFLLVLQQQSLACVSVKATIAERAQLMFVAVRFESQHG